MNPIWGRLAAELSLKPDLGRLGRPRPRQAFVGWRNGCQVTLLFDTAGGGVRGIVAKSRDDVLSGDDDLRILPRAGLGGWPGGAKTGDAEFDARVAILTPHTERVLLRLDRPTRALLAEMIELGAWVTDDQVLIEPAATGAMATVDEARQLIDTAADLLRAVRGSRPEKLIEMAFGDPVQAQRDRAWRRVQQMAGDSRKWVQPILEAIARHFPPEGPALLARIQPAASDFEAWLALCDRYAGESGPALLSGIGISRSVGREDAIVSRLAECFTDDRRLAPEPAAIVEDARLVRALIEAWRDAPDALQAMLDWPLKGELLPVQVLGALSLHAPEALAERLARLELRTAEAQVARIEALGRLPAEVGDRALVALKPTSFPARRALLSRLEKRSGPLVDMALLDWCQAAPSAVQATAPGLFDVVARRLCAVLERTREDPLLTRCGGTLQRPLADALGARLLTERPRFGAGWLARYTPSYRTRDPEREAELLRILGEMGDPAGEGRCIGALAGSDFLRIAAARALADIGTADALAPLEELTGFFAPSEVKAVAKAAIQAIRERETRGPRGGLTVSGSSAGGGLSVDE